MKKPLVSIIIPVYNCEKQIDRCLRSILKQSYVNIEIIVINDGSTDKSEPIIKNILQTNEKIVLVNQFNQGVSVARNQGAALAKGKYLTFIDGDDYISPDYIQNFVDVAEENESELCICGYRQVTESGKVLFETIPTEYKAMEKEEFAYRMLATCSRFYKTEFWKELNISYETDKRIRGEDLPVALLTNAIARNIQCVKQTGYYYVQYCASARNNMRGLHTYKLPYDALEKCIDYIMKSDNTNSKKFFELGIFRVFTTFVFDLGVGAQAEVYSELVIFIQRIIGNYFSNYNSNECLKLFSKLKIPFCQKVAVKIFLVVYKMGLLTAVGACSKILK